MTDGNRICLVLAIFILLALLGPVNMAAAQNTALLTVLPESSEMIFDQTQTVSLIVTDGNDVNAFDITMTYDPSVLVLVSWSHGDYLTDPANLIITNTPGFFQLVALQPGTPAVSGDGLLLSFSFHGTANGISPLELVNAVFANPDGIETIVQRQNSIIHVHSDPALLDSFDISGQIILQGMSASAALPVSLGYGLQHWLGPYQGITVADGSFSIAGVYADSYRITAEMPRCLSLHAGLNKIKTFSTASTQINPLLLRCGNAVWQREVDGQWVPDNIIDTADVSLVGSQYHQSGPDLDGDVNYSGRVDIFDLALVAGNLDLTSETAYQEWIP